MCVSIVKRLATPPSPIVYRGTDQYPPKHIDIEERYITTRSPPSGPQLEEETKDNKAGTSDRHVKSLIIRDLSQQ